MESKNMVYIQSGGPTSVINSSLYGAILEGKKTPLISLITYMALNMVLRDLLMMISSILV